MCVPAIVNLYIQTKVDLFLITRGNIELWAIHSGQLSKNSQCQLNRILKSPSVRSSYIYELTDNTWSTLHVLNISYFYTSLGFLQLHIARKHDRCFRDKHMFRKEFYKMLVRIFLQHKQAHLFGTIVVINNLNLIGSICFNSHRTFETHFLRQSASTEAIFSSTWNLHAKSLCSEKLVSHDSNSSNSGTLKKIRR